MSWVRCLGTIFFYLGLGYFLYNLLYLEPYIPFILTFWGLAAACLMFSPKKDIENPERVKALKVSKIDDAFLRRNGNPASVNLYNQKHHEHMIAIDEAFRQVDEQLAAKPNMKMKEQLRLARIKLLKAGCEKCTNQLVLFKGFLVYCPNCGRFVTELGGRKH